MFRRDFSLEYKGLRYLVDQLINCLPRTQGSKTYEDHNNLTTLGEKLIFLQNQTSNNRQKYGLCIIFSARNAFQHDRLQFFPQTSDIFLVIKIMKEWMESILRTDSVSLVSDLFEEYLKKDHFAFLPSSIEINDFEITGQLSTIRSDVNYDIKDRNIVVLDGKHANRRGKIVGWQGSVVRFLFNGEKTVRLLAVERTIGVLQINRAIFDSNLQSYNDRSTFCNTNLLRKSFSYLFSLMLTEEAPDDMIVMCNKIRKKDLNIYSNFEEEILNLRETPFLSIIDRLSSTAASIRNWLIKNTNMSEYDQLINDFLNITLERFYYRLKIFTLPLGPPLEIPLVYGSLKAFKNSEWKDKMNNKRIYVLDGAHRDQFGKFLAWQSGNAWFLKKEESDRISLPRDRMIAIFD